jgi:hypothetical protein
MEVADGFDDYSEGKPALAPGTKTRPYGRLIFRRPRKHKWRFSNPREVRELLTRLKINERQVVSHVNVGDQLISIAETFPTEASWGWSQIEHAMGELTKVQALERAVPVWNTDERTLSFNGQVVHRFRQPRGNQVAIVEAFSTAGWPQRIENPIKGHLLSQTLRDLNRQVATAFKFHADGDGGIRWERIGNEPDA